MAYDAIVAIRDFCKTFKLGTQNRNKTKRLKAGKLVTEGAFICKRSALLELYKITSSTYGEGYSEGYKNGSDDARSAFLASIPSPMRRLLAYMPGAARRGQ